MSNHYLLDTSAAIALLNGNPAIEQKIEGAASVSLPVITLGELYFGAENSARVDENLDKVVALSERFDVIDCDHAVARMYGQIAFELKSKGRPIQPNDMWIAAIARQLGLILLTKDSHFKFIDILEVSSW